MSKRTSLVGMSVVMALFSAGCSDGPGDFTPEDIEESAGAITSNLDVYSDALATGWNSWASWTTHNVAATSPVHGGTNAISVTWDGSWAGLELRPSSSSPVDATSCDLVRFWIHGGSTGAQKVRFFLRAGDGSTGAKVNVALQANQWSLVEIPLSSLGSPAQIKGLIWQEAGGSDFSTFSIDDVTLVTNTPPTPLSLSVNVSAGRHAISDDIYGINGLKITPAMATALRLPLRRWGGNAASRYNYQTDGANRAADYYFMNAGEYKPNPGSSTSAADQFVAQNVATSTGSLITIPMIGYVAKDKTSCGFDTRLYPNQKSAVGYCGSGVYQNNALVTGNNPLESSAVADASFVQGWVSHLVTQFGTAAQGGVKYYNLDNEPALWNDTHRDVHPDPLTYNELRDRSIAYAAAVKAADPSAKTLGPVAWGWDEYFYSALDRVVTSQCVTQGRTSWWDCRQDRRAHGDVPLAAWYLQQMKAHQDQTGVRLLDYFDLHYYPAGGVALASAGSASTQEMRLRSTRSLWDPTYVDESWIGEPVQLLPRMRGWVNQNYPGTKIAITEYNFGALDHMNGALAQADVLGIFGREGVDLATLWTYDPSSMPTFDLTHPGAFAFRMYRNYDGAGHGFGDQAVQSSSTDQALLSVYAAQRSSDGYLTIVVVNKSGASKTVPLSLSSFTPSGAAAVYRYSDANLSAIVQEANQPVAASGFTATYPANSVTLFVVPGT
jgi:hypothetical protein